MIETTKFYRARQRSSGLEILVFAFSKDGQVWTLHGCDVEGLAVSVPYSDVIFNWSYDAKKDDWVDMNLPDD